MTTHSVYNVPVNSQVSALRAIETGDEWIEEVRDRYHQGAQLVASRLEADFLAAQGGGYVFANLDADLGERSTLTWLAELLHEGVSLSPGVAFGDDFQRWVRICYMSVPLPKLERAVDIINRSLERVRRNQSLPGVEIPPLSI